MRGNNRSNASLEVYTAGHANASLRNGSTYTADISTDLMLVMIPNYN